MQFNETIDELAAVLEACRTLEPLVTQAGEQIVASLRQGGKLLTCGNGGSAADALHLSEELVGRYKTERRSLPAICLNADVTALTCIGNDYGYEQVFARQVDGLAREGDVLVGFTTSGNSPNVLAAFRSARALGCLTVLLGGGDGGKAKGMCDIEIVVPSAVTARVQEVHTVVLHQWLEEIDGKEW